MLFYIYTYKLYCKNMSFYSIDLYNGDSISELDVINICVNEIFYPEYQNM